MIRKLTLAAAFGAGYVLGAKAGKDRYAQISAGVQKVAATPVVQTATEKVTAKAADVTHQVKDRATAVAGDAVETVKDKAAAVTSETAAAVTDKVGGTAEADNACNDHVVDLNQASTR